MADIAVSAPNASAPSNPIAARQAVKLHVTRSGIQTITGAALADAGIDLANTPAEMLHVWRNGRQVAVQEKGIVDGRLAPASELRFNAPQPGDRWNAGDTYWISLDAAPGLRMTDRAANPGGASAVAIAMQRGTWHQNRIYDSLRSGPSDDHWFAFTLIAASASAAITLTDGLPPVSGEATITVAGVATLGAQHTLSAQMGDATGVATWSGTGNWVVTFTLNMVAADNHLHLALVPGATQDGIEVDSIEWQMPVTLDFEGRGAAFESVPGQQGYLLRNMPGDRMLYDVSDPAQPTVVMLDSGVDIRFEDGSLPRDYVLSESGNIGAPVLSAHGPADLSALQYADQIYIAPATLQTALAPLVALRQSQGLSVLVVDPQDIYDAWSFGQVSPVAIRTFLRYLRSEWGTAPRYVTLVGDGSSDPRGFVDARPENANVVPPYLAAVDGKIGETACDLCYAQLDGDNPLSDLKPDLAIGRLPVKTANELDILVQKIVGYETASLNIDGGAWRARVAFAADNYQEADGSTDGAGNFSYLSELAVGLQRSGADVKRMYYDPYQPTARTQTWRESDALSAYTKTMALFNNGASIINLYGHGLPTHFAQTAGFVNPYDGAQSSFLLTYADPDRMTNGNRLPIVLQMACLMGAFQTPQQTASGTTLDENLLLARGGGAVAVVGSSGMVNLFVYSNLQQGFFRLLSSPTPARIGDVVVAGQQELVKNGGVHALTGFTYILLGDPAMTVRTATSDEVGVTYKTFVPAVFGP